MSETARGIAQAIPEQPSRLSGAARSAMITVGLVAVGVGVLTAGAWLTVPFYPVPLTMQTLAVLLVGGLLGPRMGVASVASYLVLGLSGAPVFHAGTGGAAVLLGPTGGYLVGFLPAALLMGLLAGRAHAGASQGSAGTRHAPAGGDGTTARFRTLALLVAGAVLAEIAIYACGVPWLAVAYAGGSLSRAAAVGLVPYLLGDLLKIAVGIAAVRTGSRALSRRGLPLF